MLKLKRVYESPAPADGYRILVDRLWPRGLRKENAAIDLWVKDVAPSNELRKRFGHDPEKWPDFRKRYRQELKEQDATLEQLREDISRHKTVTLLYSARDTEHNNAVVLKDYLEKKR